MSKKDLLTYPGAQLLQLGKQLGLPTHVDRATLAGNIATKLIDKHWRGQRGTMTKEELPYKGDIAKAQLAETETKQRIDEIKREIEEIPVLKKSLPLEKIKLKNEEKEIEQRLKEIALLEKIPQLKQERKELEQRVIKIKQRLIDIPVIIKNLPLKEIQLPKEQEEQSTKLPQLQQDIKTIKTWIENLTKEELPYEGNKMKALSEKDTQAFRIIQIWQDAAARQAERSKALAAEAAKKEVPKGAEDCENPIDYITQEEWTAGELPDVKIMLWDAKDPINGPQRTLCFNREQLQKWIDDPVHQMGVWIPNTIGGDLDDDGHGGGPTTQVITQLPSLGDFIFGNDDFIAKEYIGIPTATDIRIGNRAGTIGMSQLHGQVPGKTVYAVLIPAPGYEEIYKQDFMEDMDNRQDMGVTIYSVLSGVVDKAKKDRLFEITNDAVADEIASNEELALFAEVSESPEIIALKKLPEFKTIVNNFITEVQVENDVETGAEELQKIFKLLAKKWGEIRQEKELVSEEGGLINNMYVVITDVFPPDYKKIIQELTFEEIIKASQNLWNWFPARDEDYTEEGERVGTGIGPSLEEFPVEFLEEEPTEEVLPFRSGFYIDAYLIEPNAELQDANLSGALLANADLRDANMAGAHLEDADLAGANLRSVNLTGAYLENANLQGALLENATLSGSGMQNATLTLADLMDATLIDVILTNAILENADLTNAVVKRADFDGANLSEAILENADLGGATFRGANLWSANLQGAKLQGAKLQGADLRHADLTYANMLDAKLEGAKIEGAYFIDAEHPNYTGAIGSPILDAPEFEEPEEGSAETLLRSNFYIGDHLIGPDEDLSYANLQGADLSSANLEGADLTGAQLQGAILSGAFLSEANLSRADLSAADLSGADFWGAQLQDAVFYNANIQDAYLADAINANLTGAIGVPKPPEETEETEEELYISEEPSEGYEEYSEEELGDESW